MKILTFITFLFCICSSHAQQAKSGNAEVELLLSQLFSSIHIHLSAWEKVDTTGEQEAVKVSKEAYSQLKKTISKLRRKKIPNKTDKHILAKEFEKNLALLNKRLDSTEKKLRTSNAFWQASEPFGSLLEKNHPTVLKYASIDAVRAADQ